MKKVVIVSAIFIGLFGLLLWQGYLTVTPRGAEAGRSAMAETKAQAKKAAAWTLETVFEKK